LAREVGFSRATLELDVARGVIPAIRIAGRTFVTKQAVAEYARTKQRRRGAKSLTPTSA
jgi:hypothetical protein